MLIRDAPVDEIEEAIRPGGISKVKSARIKSILRAITETAPGGELSLDSLAELTVPEAQQYLTSLPGVGRKTAACVLLFAFGMRDVPVDTHVSRVGTRLGLFRPRAPFEEMHDAMLEITPPGRGTRAPLEHAPPRPADVPRAPAGLRGLRTPEDVPERVRGGVMQGPPGSRGVAGRISRHSTAWPGRARRKSCYRRLNHHSRPRGWSSGEFVGFGARPGVRPAAHR